MAQVNDTFTGTNGTELTAHSSHDREPTPWATGKPITHAQMDAIKLRAAVEDARRRPRPLHQVIRDVLNEWGVKWKTSKV